VSSTLASGWDIGARRSWGVSEWSLLRFTVVKHEALAINRSRRRMLGSSELDFDALEARTTASPEERALASDRVARSAEALHGLKPQEVRALWLKALGHSYEQICEATGWTYTKV
jgi:DNA-directed RNA polymerase specialized sigma24 family protein